MSSSRKRQATRKDRKRRGRAPGWLLLGGGVALGLGAALTAVYMFSRTPAPPAADRAVMVPPHPPAKAAPKPPPPEQAPAADSAPQKPRFDFYTMLPKLKVFVPEPREDAPQAPATHGTEIDGQGTYALQVGSFRQLDDANRVKAKLALIGVEADIYTVTVNEMKWHRLRVGPYSDLKKLHDITGRLRKHHINYMVLKING